MMIEQLIILLQLIGALVLLLLFQILIGRVPCISTNESKRRWEHAISGQLIIYVIQQQIFSTSLIVVALVLSIITTLIVHIYFINIFILAFGGFLRPYEMKTYKQSPPQQQQQQRDESNANTTSSSPNNNKYMAPGMVWFLLGVVITMTCFSNPIAVYAIECLSIADPVAAYIGQTFKSKKLSSYPLLRLIIPNHILQNSTATYNGSLACFITSWIIGWYMFVVRAESSTLTTTATSIRIPLQNYLAITFGATACTVSEAFYIGNDNICIPFATASVVSMFL